MCGLPLLCVCVRVHCVQVFNLKTTAQYRVNKWFCGVGRKTAGFHKNSTHTPPTSTPNRSHNAEHTIKFHAYNHRQANADGRGNNQSGRRFTKNHKNHINVYHRFIGSQLEWTKQTNHLHLSNGWVSFAAFEKCTFIGDLVSAAALLFQLIFTLKRREF